MSRSKLKLQSGMSLVEVMVLVALLATGLTVFMSTLTSQQQQAAQLNDKLASLDLERSLRSTLANVCTFMFTSAPPFTVDPTNLAAATLPTFAQIPSRPVAGASPVLVANGTALASPLSPRLVANAIRIENLACATPPCTPTTNQFTANLLVVFDTSRAAGPIAPLSIPVQLGSTGGAGAQTVNTCTFTPAGGGGGGGVVVDRVLVESVDSCGGSPSHPNCNFVPAFVFATCPVGYRVSGCGYRMTVNNPQPSGQPPPWNNFHSASPDDLIPEGNSCKMDAGGAPGCGICFKAQAICLRLQ